MSTIRGRAIKVGGIATEPAGFSTRTGGLGDNGLTRPAYQSAAGQIQPLSNLDLGHPLLDLRGLPARRLAVIGLAAAYVTGFHLTLGRLGVGLPRPHQHVAAQLLLIASYLILINASVDVLAGSFPNSTWARALKQAATD